MNTKTIIQNSEINSSTLSNNSWLEKSSNFYVENGYSKDAADLLKEGYEDCAHDITEKILNDCDILSFTGPGGKKCITIESLKKVINNLGVEQDFQKIDSIGFNELKNNLNYASKIPNVLEVTKSEIIKLVENSCQEYITENNISLEQWKENAVMNYTQCNELGFIGFPTGNIKYKDEIIVEFGKDLKTDSGFFVSETWRKYDR